MAGVCYFFPHRIGGTWTDRPVDVVLCGFLWDTSSVFKVGDDRNRFDVELYGKKSNSLLKGL